MRGRSLCLICLANKPWCIVLKGSGILRLGVEIFGAAVASLFKHWSLALRILLVPLAVLVAVSVWENQVEYTWANLAEVILLVVDFVFLTVVAVGWHRFVLLSEKPGAVLPRLPAKPMFAYFISWIVLILVITFSFAAIGAVLFFAFKELKKTGVFDSFADVAAMQPATVLIGAFLLVFASIWAFTYALLRLGTRLPARAAFGKSIGLDASRVITKPIGGALIVTAALVSGLTLLLAYAPMLLLKDPTMFATKPTSTQVIVSNIGYGLTVLVGAAVLNEVFRRCVPHEELSQEIADTGAGERV